MRTWDHARINSRVNVHVLCVEVLWVLVVTLSLVACVFTRHTQDQV